MSYCISYISTCGFSNLARSTDFRSMLCAPSLWRPATRSVPAGSEKRGDLCPRFLLGAFRAPRRFTRNRWKVSTAPLGRTEIMPRTAAARDGVGRLPAAAPLHPCQRVAEKAAHLICRVLIPFSIPHAPSPRVHPPRRPPCRSQSCSHWRSR